MKQAGRHIKPYANEHTVATWLREAETNKHFLVKYLNISYPKLHKALTKPQEYFCISQLLLISGLVQRPFLDVFFAVFPYKKIEREAKKKWYENTGLEIEYIPYNS